MLPIFALSLGAQSSAPAAAVDSARVAIESAVRRADVEAIVAARADVERALTAYAGDALLMHYRGYALYREAAIRRAGGADVRPLLDDADRSLARSAAARALPETFAVRSAVIGMRIGKSALSAMRLGPRSTVEMSRAKAAGPTNPRVWLLAGATALFTPGMFGGGTDKAQQALERAVALFASDAPAAPLPAWGRAEAFTWLGQVYQKQRKRDRARAAFEQSLALEPDNAQARELLRVLDAGGGR